jgi:hypothetical protein
VAATDAGARLTEAHRLAQLRIRAQMAREFLLAWRLLDPARLDATAGAWIAAVRVIVARYRSASAGLAGAYLQMFRAAETGDLTPLRVVLADPVKVGALETSLLVTGPYALKRETAASGLTDEAIRRALAGSLGAAIRHTLDGGRATVIGTVGADERANGWRRVTDSKPCHFCALLASRGAVYSENSSDFRAHDRCGCATEPVYSGFSLSPREQAWDDLYQRAVDETPGPAGPATLAAFRRLYEGRAT